MVRRMSHSFCDWTETDPLPKYDGDVSGFELFSLGCFPEEVVESRPEDHPGHCPGRTDFAPSFLHVSAPTVPTGGSPSSRARVLPPGQVVPEPGPRGFQVLGSPVSEPPRLEGGNRSRSGGSMNQF
jgi:hypothetical protein